MTCQRAYQVFFLAPPQTASSHFKTNGSVHLVPDRFFATVWIIFLIHRCTTGELENTRNCYMCPLCLSDQVHQHFKVEPVGTKLVCRTKAHGFPLFHSCVIGFEATGFSVTPAVAKGKGTFFPLLTNNHSSSSWLRWYYFVAVDIGLLHYIRTTVSSSVCLGRGTYYDDERRSFAWKGYELKASKKRSQEAKLGFRWSSPLSYDHSLWWSDGLRVRSQVGTSMITKGEDVNQ